MAMWPSELRNTNTLEDKWFQPLYKKLALNRNLPKSKQVPCLAAGSMQSYLGSLKQLCTYSLNRNIYIGLQMSDITRLDMKIKELINRLQVFKDDRKAQYDEWRLETLISPGMTCAWGKSDHIQSVRVFLVTLTVDIDIRESDAVDSRDYFMLQIAFQNACRSSNMLNMTLADVENALPDEKFLGAMVLRNKKYKTSMLYGDKIIVIPKDIFDLLKKYIKYVRPLLLQNKKDEGYIFQSKGSGAPMEGSNVSKCLTRSMKKSGVTEAFDGDSSVSCIRIRASVATELAGLGDEKLEVIANTFMKNKRDTTAKYYVKAWSQREAVRISMKCAQIFHLNGTEEEIIEHLDKFSAPLVSKENVIDFVKNHLSCNEEDISRICEFLKDMRIPESTEINFQRSTENDYSENIEMDAQQSSTKNNEHLPYVEEIKFLQNDWITSKTLNRGVILAIIYLVADKLERGDTTLGKEVWNELLTYADHLNFSYPYIYELKDMTAKWQIYMKDLLRYMVQKYDSTKSSDSFIQMRRASQVLIQKAIIETN